MSVYSFSLLSFFPRLFVSWIDVRHGVDVLIFDSSHQVRKVLPPNHLMHWDALVDAYWQGDVDDELPLLYGPDSSKELLVIVLDFTTELIWARRVTAMLAKRSLRKKAKLLVLTNPPGQLMKNQVRSWMADHLDDVYQVQDSGVHPRGVQVIVEHIRTLLVMKSDSHREALASEHLQEQVGDLDDFELTSEYLIEEGPIQPGL
jgi:hypothetical protein